MSKQLFMDGTKLNRHLKDVADWQSGKSIAPIHLEISVSNYCNQKCVFCYIDWQHGKVHMQEDMLLKLIFDAKAAGVKSALIAGEGEPTLNKAYIAGVKKASEVGLDMALNSNMLAVSKKELHEVLPHLAWLRCSVQAADAETYAKMHNTRQSDFGRVCENIRAAAEIKHEMGLDIQIGVQQVLMEENGHTVYDLAKLSKEMGADYYVLKPCHPHELNSYKSAADMLERYNDVLLKAQELSGDGFNSVIRWEFLNIKERKYSKCLALPFIWQINASGDIYSCYPKAYDERFFYGSLKGQSFVEILKSDKYKEVCEWVRENVDVHKCMLPCRHHNANDYLWWLTEEEPHHINFI